MPVIHTHVSVKTTREQRENIKKAYGQAISVVPGKSEAWLMCPFNDDMPIYFAGQDAVPVAYVEVNLLGRNEISRDIWERLTVMIMGALESELNIPPERIYIRYMASQDWGWNNGNF